MKPQLLLLLILAVALPIQVAAASDLSVTVVDTSGKAVPNAVVSFQNGAGTTDTSGHTSIQNIPQNMTWLFTVSADNYNLYTEQIKLTSNTSNKLFTLTSIQVEGQVAPSAIPTNAPVQKPTETAINIRFHVIDTGNAAIPLASVNLFGKVRYTNLYGDVDFPITKGTASIDAAIQKNGYSSFTDTYTIPASLQDDNFRLEVQLTPVNASTPQVFDSFTKMEQPFKSVLSPATAKTPGTVSKDVNYTFPFSMLVVGLLIILLPGDNEKPRKRRRII